MSVARAIVSLSAEEYLATEAQSSVRREYVAGSVYAMAGGSERHNLISLNIAALLRAHLRGGTCRTFVSDIKLRTQATETPSFYYPDVMVVCDPTDRDPLVKTCPSVVFEVLSPSTENIDRREKRLAYLRIPSLGEYVLVDQDQPEVTVYRSASPTTAEVLSGPEATSEITSLQLTLTLGEIYADLPAIA